MALAELKGLCKRILRVVKRIVYVRYLQNVCWKLQNCCLKGSAWGFLTVETAIHCCSAHREATDNVVVLMLMFDVNKPGSVVRAIVLSLVDVIESCTLEVSCADCFIPSKRAKGSDFRGLVDWGRRWFFRCRRRLSRSWDATRIVWNAVYRISLIFTK